MNRKIMKDLFVYGVAGLVLVNTKDHAPTLYFAVFAFIVLVGVILFTQEGE